MCPRTHAITKFLQAEAAFDDGGNSGEEDGQEFEYNGIEKPNIRNITLLPPFQNNPVESATSASPNSSFNILMQHDK